MLEAALALGLLAMLVVAAQGWGWWGLRLFRLDLPVADRLVIAQALGWGLMSFPLLALGLANVLYPAAIWAVVVLGLVVAVIEFRRGKAMPSAMLRPFRMRWALAATAILLILTLPGALGPPSETDSLRAELAQAKVWLQQHGATFTPNYHWNQPPLAEFLYVLGLAVGPDTLPALIHWWMAILSALTLFALGRHLFGVRAAALGALFYAATPALVYSTASTKQELFLSLYGWLALYGLLAWNTTRQRGWLALAGLLAGFGAATKLMGLYTFPILGLLLLWLSWRHDRRPEAWGGHLANALIFGAAAMLPVLPWWVRNYALTGDPIWPAGASLFAGRYIPPAMSGFLSKVKNDFGVGRSLTTFLLGPWFVTQNYAVFSDPRTPTPPTFLLFLPGLWVGWRERSSIERTALTATLAFCAGVYAFWWAQPQVPRYLYPLWGAASLVSGAAAAKLIEWKGVARAAALAGITVTVVVSATLSLAFSRQFLPLLTGRESRDDYLRRSVSYYDDFRAVSRLAPPGSRLFVLEALSLYYLEPDYLMALPPWEGMLDYEQVHSGAELFEHLRALGISHILWIDKPGRPTDLVREMEAAGLLEEIYRNPEGRRIGSRTLGLFTPSEVVLWRVRYEADNAP